MPHDFTAIDPGPIKELGQSSLFLVIWGRRRLLDALGCRFGVKTCDMRLWRLC